MKRFLIGTSLFFTAAFLFGGSVFAQQKMSLAPAKEKTPVEQSSAKTSTDSISSEFSVISEWEAKIVAKIPQSVKDRVNLFDQKRLEFAAKYRALRDETIGTSAPALKINAKDQKVSVVDAPGARHYWYVALTFIFEHAYVFYGILLLAVFLIFRFVLRRLNIIV